MTQLCDLNKGDLFFFERVKDTAYELVSFMYDKDGTIDRCVVRRVLQEMNGTDGRVWMLCFSVTELENANPYANVSRARVSPSRQKRKEMK